jgi:hypothetical protein
LLSLTKDNKIVSISKLISIKECFPCYFPNSCLQVKYSNPFCSTSNVLHNFLFSSFTEFQYFLSISDPISRVIKILFASYLASLDFYLSKCLLCSFCTSYAIAKLPLIQRSYSVGWKFMLQRYLRTEGANRRLLGYKYQFFRLPQGTPVCLSLDMSIG